MKRAAHRAGYTLVEVMLSVSVLFLGTAGFTMMQGASARAIQGAQEQAVAVHFLETWVERLRRDALFWTAPGVVSLESTQYLQGQRGAWITPAYNVDSSGLSFAADAYGRDVEPGPRARFCVNVRLTPAHYWTPARGPSVAADEALDALRVDVRVWWSRLGGSQASFRADGGEDCGAVPDDKAFSPDRYRRVVTSTMVRWR